MVSRTELLQALVTRYDVEEDPVSVEALSEALGVDPGEVRSAVLTLRDSDLVREVPGASGFRPTVTARDFLALDIDDDSFVVIDAGE